MYELVFRPDPDSTTHGILCIRDTSNNYDHPIRQQIYWPASARTSLANAIDYFPELAGGPLQVEPASGSGQFSFRRNHVTLYVRIVGGGTTLAIANDEERIPEPKVRRGIETRYRAGRWEKYLKSQGWVSA